MYLQRSTSRFDVLRFGRELSTLAVLSSCLFASVAQAQSEAVDKIYTGDTVVITADDVELGLKDKVAVVLQRGDEMQVTEIRDKWIGGYAIVDDERHTGWVHRNQVRLGGTDPGTVTQIEVPDQPDDPAAVDALRTLKVELEVNAEGNVIAASAIDSEINDAGLKHFQGLHQLATLDLSERPITDAGFGSLGELPVLQELYLNDTQVTDKIFTTLSKIKNLEVLTVGNTKITGSELGQLKKLKSLRTLNLGGTTVGDQQLKPLGEMPQLEVLVISRTKVTGEGLEHLSSITKLRVLNLIGCDVQDEGLDHLQTLDKLRMLYVEDTPITEEGADALSTVNPSLAVFQ